MRVQSPGSHNDHLLRQTRIHHVQLSSMADFKANILLTMSSVVVTMVLGHINDPTLKLACLPLIVFCLITIALATYVVMPHLPFLPQKKQPPDIKSPNFNLLFFGDFTRLDYETFEASFEEVLNSPSEAYRVQVREIYQLGVFLARKKFRVIRLAYLSFITGFITSGATMLFTIVQSN